MRNSGRDFLLVGVTGGIGSGKSAAAQLLSHLGRHTISADVVAKSLMTEDASLRSAITRQFGGSAYHHDGTLNRPFLAQTVFSDPRQRKALERLVHPPTIAFIHHQAASLPAAQRRPYMVVEAALIFESGFDKDLDRVIVVVAEEETCTRRIMARDHLSASEVAGRMRAQMSPTLKARRADFVIENNGSIDELRSRIVFIDRLLQQMVP
jgi:dephospho-CoA kinase